MRTSCADAEVVRRLRATLAEDRGFEPLRAFTQHAFQACALGHYANPPSRRLPERAPHPTIDRSNQISNRPGIAARVVPDPPRGGTSPNSPRAGRQQGQASSSRYVGGPLPVSYTHLRAHETRHDLVCRLLLEKKK